MYRLSGQSRLQRKNECVIMQWLPLLMWRRLTFGEIVSESRFWHMQIIGAGFYERSVKDEHGYNSIDFSGCDRFCGALYVEKT